MQSASDVTRVSAFSVDLWRLLVLSFFVQFEILVELQGKCITWRCSRKRGCVVQSASHATRVSALFAEERMLLCSLRVT